VRQQGGFGKTRGENGRLRARHTHEGRKAAEGGPQGGGGVTSEKLGLISTLWGLTETPTSQSTTEAHQQGVAVTSPRREAHLRESAKVKRCSVTSHYRSHTVFCRTSGPTDSGTNEGCPIK